MPWRRGYNTAKFHTTKPEVRFCASSDLARCLSEVCDGENLWQWSQLKIRHKRLFWASHCAI